MTSKFYIKQYDTAEELKVVMKKRQAAVDGVTPPDSLWLTSNSITQVYFSMAKIPQTLTNGDILYPDGTIHKTDGTILNPIDNTAQYISNIQLQPGELLYEDYSVLQTNGYIRYPSGLIKNLSNQYLIPSNSLLLPNGMIQLPPNPAYPSGYAYNPNDQDRTNYYKVGNPTELPTNPDGTIPLPANCYIDTDFSLKLPYKVLQLPSTTQVLSTTTVKFPSGTTKEDSTTIDRENALVLPKTIVTYPAYYTVIYSSSTRRYSFPTGSALTFNSTTKTATITFPDSSTMAVPYTTVKYSEYEYIFPYATEHFSSLKQFKFPGEIITLPLSATINVFGPSVSVTFEEGTLINASTLEATLTNQNQLLINGDTLIYDSSLIKLNTNHTVLYNNYEFYPRGTQKNPYGTIIHPDGYIDEPPYIRYYPTTPHPDGLLIRQSDGAIVNNDGTFTKLDNSVVDADGRVIQLPNTELDYYQSPSNPPIIPVSTQSQFIVINHSTGSFQDITYIVTGSELAHATLIKYQWLPEDTSHLGLYSGEFEIHFSNGTKRTFPILKNDALLIEVLEHFSTGE